VGATEKEKTRSIELATEYIQTAPERRTECPLYLVNSRSEPIEFSVYFHGWVDSSCSSDIYSRSPQLVAVSAPNTISTPVSNLVGTQSLLTSESTFHPSTEEPVAVSVYAQLKEVNPNGIIVKFERLRIKPPPEGVDGENMEGYLSVQEFKEYFKKDPHVFFNLPKWQRLQIKKEIGLF